MKTKDKKIKADALPLARRKYLAAKRRDRIKVAILQVSLLVVLIGLWQLCASVGIIDDFITSSPVRIVKTLASLFTQDLMKHVGITLLECIVGFAVSGLLGFAIAVGLWASDTARRVLEPYIVTLNSLPKIALGPIIIVWMGAGMKSIVTMTVLICVVVTVINVLAGFTACDEGKILLMRSMGANKMQIFFKLVLPQSLPSLISTLKINVGLAWVGTIMGEYLVSSAGLGYLIIYGGQVFKLDLVMTSTVILCVLAALMYLAVALIEKRVSSRR
ncbi:MAG: ABC transporter permease [Clostridia bacterium]|nr:ABC transporter permease [Clostridia bacterium]